MKKNKSEKGKISGLSGKFIFSIVLFGMFLCLTASYIGYREFTDVLETQYNDMAYNIAYTARNCIDGDKVAQYLDTLEKDEDYEEMQKSLDNLLETMEATYIYVAGVAEDYLTLTYVFDAYNAKSQFPPFELGYVSKDVNEQYRGNMEKVMTTGERVDEYCYSYSEKFGAHTTAGVAVYDSSGEIVAFLGVEKAMTTLENARKTYVFSVVLATMAAVIIFVIACFLYLHHSVIRPLLLITNEAQSFIRNETNASNRLQEVKNRDEIGSLAKAVGQMELDIREYIENLTLVTAEKERIGAELNVATQIQADMLPRIFPAFPQHGEFDIYATMTPAKEVGGDFYDFFMADEKKLVTIIADVSGKGVPAALFMVIAKTLLKNQAGYEKDPSKVFETVNNQLCENNEAGLFVTAWMGVLDLETHVMTYVNAGHNPPVLIREEEELSWVEGSIGLVLAGMEGMEYRSQQITLQPGDRLFLYTDGVTEATRLDEEMFGEERLARALMEVSRQPLSEVLHTVKTQIDSFVGEAEQFDDITMLIMQYNG